MGEAAAIGDLGDGAACPVQQLFHHLLSLAVLDKAQTAAPVVASKAREKWSAHKYKTAAVAWRPVCRSAPVLPTACRSCT